MSNQAADELRALARIANRRADELEAVTPPPEPSEPDPQPPTSFQPAEKLGILFGPGGTDPLGAYPLYAERAGNALEILYYASMADGSRVLKYALIRDVEATWEGQGVAVQRSLVSAERHWAAFGRDHNGEIIALVQKDDSRGRRLEIHKTERLTASMKFRFHKVLFDYSHYISDTHSIVGYDEKLNRIIFFIRRHRGEGKGIFPRDVTRLTTDLNFGDPDVDFSRPVSRVSLEATEEQPRDVYSLYAKRFGNDFLGIANIHIPGGPPPYNSAAGLPYHLNHGPDNTLHSQLVKSTDDGLTWQRMMNRIPVIGNGTPGPFPPNDDDPAYDSGQVLTTCGYLDNKNNWILLYRATPYRHLVAQHDKWKRFYCAQARLRVP